MFARYADEPVFLQPDSAPGPRGFGLKVFLDVPGGNHVLLTCGGMKGPRLKISWSTMRLGWTWRTLIRCWGLWFGVRSTFDNPVALSAAMKLRRDVLKQNAPGMLLNTNLISHSFFTQYAFRFGERYGSFGAFPRP